MQNHSNAESEQIIEVAAAAADCAPTTNVMVGAIFQHQTLVNRHPYVNNTRRSIDASENGSIFQKWPPAEAGNYESAVNLAALINQGNLMNGSNHAQFYDNQYDLDHVRLISNH